jgi:quercetin dioxygenase-like cupin family protein
MLVAGKVWGKTAEIFANASFEMHRITIQPGHKCSRHRHDTKFNGFFVEFGALEIIVWQPTGAVDKTMLRQGESLIVPPGVVHQFVAHEHAVVFETYWTELKRDDIYRFETGE